MFTIYSAKIIGVPNNCLYPDKHTVNDAAVSPATQ